MRNKSNILKNPEKYLDLSEDQFYEIALRHVVPPHKNNKIEPYENKDCFVPSSKLDNEKEIAPDKNEWEINKITDSFEQKECIFHQNFATYV